MAETARGTKPQDHKQSQKAQHEARLEQDAILADMPELVPPYRLRFRDKARFRSLLLDVAASGVFDGIDAGDTEGGELEVDKNSIDPEMIDRVKHIDQMCGDIDEWAESVAIDRDAYIEWSRGKDYDVFFAILNRYQDALGESTGS
jgi:hypothetical protein